MDDYESHIKQAEDYLHEAHNKLHADDGIRYALLGIGHILLAQGCPRVKVAAKKPLPPIGTEPVPGTGWR
jgi:hypothetical protein